MRHDVGEVVAAARLQVDVADRVGQLGGRGDVLAGELEVTRRRLDPRREQQRAGAVADRGRVAGGVERRQDPLRAAAVAEDDPGPAEPVDDAEREQRVVRGAPGQGGVDVGALGPGEGEMLGLAALRTPVRGGSGGRGEPRGVRGEGALGQPGLRHRVERERADAVEQPVARRAVVVDDHERAAREPPDHVDRRRRGHVERLEDELDRGQRRAAGERGQRPQAPLVVGEQQLVAPPDRRLAAPGGARGLRLVGSLSTLKRSSRRRVISSIDSVLVRAAASSIASGSPSSERHRSRTASPASPRGGAHAVNSSTASASASGASSNTASPSTSSGTWLVHRIRSPRGGVEEADRERRGRVDDVLAVVEDHHRGGALEPLEQRRLAAGDVQRGDQRVEDVVGRRRGLEPGQPDAAGRLGQPAAGRDRDRRLPDPARPDDLDEPLALAAGRTRAAISVSRPTSSADSDGRFPAARAAAERRVVVQDLLLELLQPRPGIEAELVRQPGPDPLVGRQRVGLASRSVQRGDQQLPQAFLVRVRRHGRFQLADHVVPRAAAAAASRVSTSFMRASSSRARWGAAQSPVAGSTSPR